MKKTIPEGNREEILKIKVTSETLSELLSLINIKGWEVGEGLRIILGAGYGYIFGHSDLESEKQEGLPKTSEQLLDRLIKAEARLGSLRYRTYEIQQANSNWELSSGAIYRENVGLQNVAKKRLEEVDKLRLKVKRLEDEIEKLNQIVKKNEGNNEKLPQKNNVLKGLKMLRHRP